MTQATESSTSYHIAEAILSSDRTTTGIDIARLINSMVIYEHIEKPYLTMSLSFADEENIVQDFDIQGGERLKIKIIDTEEVESGNEINKQFVVDKIVKAEKIEERREQIVLHCTQYHMFESVVQNVNKSFVGSPTEIIKKIIDNNLSIKAIIDGEDSIRDMKVIIPNMHPIEAVIWLKKRCTTNDGFPFFVFSPLGVDNIVIRDLDRMLTQTVQNLANPYIYAPSAKLGKSNIKYYTIDDYTYESSENLVRIIEAGSVGSSNVFYDTLNGISETIHHNVNDLFQNLIVNNKLGGANSRFSFSNEFKVKDKTLGEYDSKVISTISSSGSYNNLDTVFKSYNDETVKGNQNKKIKQQALKQFLTKSPLFITVKSREFITGDANYTLGKAIRVAFLDTQSNLDNNSPAFDLKKSGDYIIMAATHYFSGEDSKTELLLGKMASLGVETNI
ncbi:MAG: hypothetical protein CMQ68_00130 [Gammaproteobacteria bacterium]|nr:hypothetical protein [Gammaproteobacteria bacterium]